MDPGSLERRTERLVKTSSDYEIAYLQQNKQNVFLLGMDECGTQRAVIHQVGNGNQIKLMSTRQ